MAGQTKKKVAILGGGIGALSAAFYLTEQKDWQDKYDITMYQQGWRLGGKCASGRDMRPGYGYRIYEHGLHIFAGFYDQSFDMLRRAYEAIDRPADHPNQTVWDAFTPEDQIALVEEPMPGHPEMTWYLNLPTNDARPGDDLNMPPLMDMVEKLVGMLLHIAPKTGTPSSVVSGGDDTPRASLLHRAGSIIRKIIDKIEEDIAEDLLNDALHEVVKIIDAEMSRVKAESVRLEFEVILQRFLKAALLAQALLNGIANDQVYQKGYDAINHYDWSEWIFKNAVEVGEKYPEWGDPKQRATELINWSPIRTFYDYAFAFTADASGVMNQRNFAAGSALKASLLLLSYKGHFFWKMQGAMGDVVVAPIYLALKKRGVKFEFFKRMTRLNISDDGKTLASIDMVSQARMKVPGLPYEPLVKVPVPGWEATLDAWPAEPRWGQLQDGALLASQSRNYELDNQEFPGTEDVAEELVHGVDYDDVILGISVGAQKQICASFPQKLPKSKWGPMFEKLTLTRTCAMQLWMTRSQADLGNPDPNRTLTGAAQPYSSWSDMTHLLDREIWNDAYRPRSIVYFCGQIGGTDVDKAAQDDATRKAIEWLTDNADRYWPKATSTDSPYSLNPKLIYDPAPTANGDVLERQYIRTNYSPSELYVQSAKGSVVARMDVNESGLENLYLAGDWTLSELNSGCVEGAARSGARCARAVAGEKLGPLLPPIGYNGPSGDDGAEYVVDGNNYVSLNAARLSDVSLHNFCVQADKTKLQAWLDKTFKAPSGGAVQYELISDKLFLGIAQLGKVQAYGNPVEENKGYTSEIDVTMWMLARKKGDGPFAVRWIPAYLFVNSGPVLATGREVWGFPKQLGRFNFKAEHEGHSAPKQFDIDGFVIKKFGPSSPTEWARIIEVRPAQTPPEPSGVLESLEAFGAKMRERLTGDLVALGKHLESAIGMGNMTMAFLKQFPDAHDPHKACYQAIVEATAKAQTVRGSGLTDHEYEVRITSYDSMPFLDELGIQPGWQNVGNGTWIDFDFIQELGTNIWEAPPLR